MMVGSVYADQTTQNLISNIRGGSGYGVWLGTGNSADLGGVHPGNVLGCCSSISGANPLLDTSNANGNGQSGQIIWSYGQATVQQIIAINQALSGTGIQINGYNWSYDVRNMNGDDRQGGVDTLSATSRLWNAAGNSILLQQSRTHNTKMEWTNFSSTVTAPTPYALADVGYLQLQFTSMDSGFWGGYYGPQIRNVQASLNYTAVPIDPCVSNPLSSPSCPGYQQAYHDQQCSANPLYATTCPGYQSAYYTQQCSINPLYDSGCPGYQQAYYNQQCSLNPLFDNQCPGYAQAYYNQQCSNNPLYDNQCPGYAQAYFDQQCSLNPLYNNSCPGYEAAYFNQQCTLDSLYNQACPGYTVAYYNLQCSISPLYDSGCPGYAQAYFDQQCSLNGLYDRSCPNYSQEYAKQQLLNQQNNQASTQTTQTVSLPTTTEPTVQVSSKGEVSTDVQIVADPVVNELLKDNAKVETKTLSEPAPVATVTPTAPVAQPTAKAEQKQEQKKTDAEIAKVEKKSDSKDTKSNREKVKEALTEKAKELANDMSNAATLEAQAANQGLVLGLMNYNPGFSAYANSIIPDTGAMEMAKQYNKPVIDNRRALRALSGASDRLHQEMVNEQYR
jgi:hypothetical protein